MSAYTIYMRVTLCVASLLSPQNTLGMDAQISADLSNESLDTDPWLHYPLPIHGVIAVGTQLRTCQLTFQNKYYVNVPPHLIYHSKALWNNAQIMPDDASSTTLKITMTSKRNQDLIIPLLQLCASAQWQENLRLETFRAEISENIYLVHKLQARILAHCPITAHFQKLSKLPETFWHEINVAANFDMTLVLTRLAQIISHIYTPHTSQSLTPNLDEKLNCFKNVLSEQIVSQKATLKTQHKLLHYLGPCPCFQKALQEQLLCVSLKEVSAPTFDSKSCSLISESTHADDPEPLVRYICHKKGAQ